MMFFKKVLILGLTVGLMVVAYFIYQFLHKKINPRKSFFHLVIFFVINLLTIFLLIFLLSLLLFKFKEFFFKV